MHPIFWQWGQALKYISATPIEVMHAQQYTAATSKEKEWVFDSQKC